MTGPETSPASLGFRMPPEWHPHRATWLAWPGNTDTWPENLGAAQAEFVRLVETIGRGETVCVIASGPALEQARRELAGIASLELFDIPTNDAWIRDYGPTFVIRPGSLDIAGVDWQYNGWGGKYPPYDQDVLVARRICQAAGVSCFSTELVAEGGALEINGQGDLITTISCLLNANRNPLPVPAGADEAAIQSLAAQFHGHVSSVLAGMLGTRTITWLSGAEIDGDDTDGHVDQQIRFAGDDCVLVVRGSSPEDPRDAAFRRTIAELRHTYSSRAVPLQGIDLPLPPAMELHGRRLPASYLNFYICNYGVIVPQFDAPLADARAVDVIGGAFPGRRVIGLPSRNLSVGLGSFHCLTQQEPMPVAGDSSDNHQQTLDEPEPVSRETERRAARIREDSRSRPKGSPG